MRASSTKNGPPLQSARIITRVSLIRSSSAKLGEAEERPLHGFPLVAQLDIRKRRDEETKGGDGGGSGPKTISRAAFNRLDPLTQRAAIMTDKMTLVD